jgi:uncharacterized protein (TIGR02145 family)
MYLKIKILPILVLTLFSCQKRDWDNPYDPDCPKEVYTPSNFKAEQQGNVVKLSWTQSKTQISGFKIERKVADGSWVEVASLSKSNNTWNDANLTGGKLHEYRLYAFAGNNQSNKVTSQITIGETVTDIEGNIYNTVTIGTQVWMAENLKSTKYKDGTSIPNVTDGSAWAGLTSGAYCWYNNDIGNKSIYGALYNWFAVNTGKLCPVGWHVSSDNEWTILSNYLGGISVAGGKMKSVAGWSNPNTGANNSSGFSALPGCYRHYTGTFNNILGEFGYWWSSTEFSTTEAYNRHLSFDSSSLGRKNN